MGAVRNGLVWREGCGCGKIGTGKMKRKSIEEKVEVGDVFGISQI